MVGGGWSCGTDIDTNRGGTVQTVATGVGLTGGPVTLTGTISVATGGITSAMLATGAVTSAKIASGAVGSAQINTAQVQARVGGTCPVGQYLRGINSDGTVVCSALPQVPVVITTVDDSLGSVGRNTSIAIGTDGLPVISYLDDSWLKVAKCANPACTGASTITTVDREAVVTRTSIAIGTDGHPVISYNSSGALTVAKLEDLIGGGFSTLTSKEKQGRIQGKAQWKDGVWHVVMRRPLSSEEQENEAKLVPGRVQTVSFAVWNGEDKERANGQKSVAPWFQLLVDPVAKLSAFRFDHVRDGVSRLLAKGGAHSSHRIRRISSPVRVSSMSGGRAPGPPAGRDEGSRHSGRRRRDDRRGSCSAGGRVRRVVVAVDEEIQKELKLQQPQGVAVFEVIGNSRADYAGIKVLNRGHHP